MQSKAKKPESMEELVKDEFFIKRMDKNFSSIMDERRKRGDAKVGYRYVRDWYDSMDEDELTLDFFLQNILSVFNKTSNLSANKRKIIFYVGNISRQETAIHYAAINVKIKNPEKTEENGEERDN